MAEIEATCSGWKHIQKCLATEGDRRALNRRTPSLFRKVAQTYHGSPLFSQDFWEIMGMRKQWIPGPFSGGRGLGMRLDYTMLMSMLGSEVEHWDCSPSERKFQVCTASPTSCRFQSSNLSIINTFCAGIGRYLELIMTYISDSFPPFASGHVPYHKNKSVLPDY